MTVNTLSSQDCSELIRLEEDLWRSGTRFDPAFQETRFAEDFIEFGRSGRLYSREDAIVTESRPIDAVLPFPDFRVRLLGDNVVQVMYTSLVMREGAPEYARRSSLWSKSSVGWVLRFHQGTPFVPGR
jgi:hypothetical protein